MLKIIPRDSVLWPVKVYVARDDGSGKTDEHIIKVRYRLLSVEELKKVKDSDEPALDFIKRNVLGWEDIADENGPLEYSQAKLDMVMNIPYLSNAISNTFWTAQVKATEKN